MPRTSRTSDSGEARVDRIIADYVRARERGESVDVAALAAEHPEHADAIREFARDYEWVGPPSGDGPAPISIESGQRVGDYVVVGEIGRGGMGVVFRARGSESDREVALKVIRAGELAGSGDVARFRREALVASRLDHPGIVPILDAGEIDGLHFIVMPLIEGGTLATESAHYSGDPRAAARVIANVARAVAHAHSQGVIHRDLKPANILMGRDGQPRVADFGLSKSESLSTSLTLTGSILGTPAYVAPEQTRSGESRDTPAADVYGLGAILYELLIGRPPFEGDTSLDVLVQVRECPPVPPGRVDPHVPADLESICMRCLEKDPARRYATASDLAEDLEAHLESRSSRARSPSMARRARRALSRSPVAFALGAVVVVVLAVTAFLLLRGRERNRMRLFDSYLARVGALRSGAGVGGRTESLELLRRASELGRSPSPRKEALLSLAALDFERISLHRIALEDGDPPSMAGYTLVLDSALSRMARVTAEDEIVVQSLAGQIERRIRERNAGEVARLSISPGGRYLACAHGAGEIWRWSVFDLESARNEPVWRADALVHRPATWRGDSRIALVTGLGDVLMRDLDTGSEDHLTMPASHVSILAFSNGGESVAVAGRADDRVFVARADDGEALLELPDCPAAGSFAWGPYDDRLAIGGERGIDVIDVATGKRRLSMSGHRHRVSALHFHPRGHLLISAGWDFTVRVWTLSTGAELVRLDDRQLLGVSRDGDTLACVDRKGAVELLRQCGEREWTTIHAPEIAWDVLPVLALDSGGRLLACATRGITLVDLEVRRAARHLGAGRFTGVAFEPVEGGLLGWGAGGLLHWTPVDVGPSDAPGERFIDPPRTLLADETGFSGPLALSQNGRSLAVATTWPYPVSVTFLDWTRPETAVRFEGPEGPPELAVSDDGSVLAVAGGRGFGLRVFTPGEGTELRQVLREGIAWLTFAVGSRELYCATRTEILRLERDSWRVTARLARESVTIGNASASPGGDFIAFQSGDERLRLLSSPDASIFATIACPRSRLGRVVVGPDGRRVFVADLGGLVRVLDLDRVDETLATLGFSPTRSPIR